MRHVHHLLVAYAHRQLTPMQQRRLWRHVARCAECRAALAREEQIAHDMQTFLPRLGQPAPGQLARLWPAIWQKVQRPAPARWSNRGLQPYGMVMALVIMCVMLSSALFQNTGHANAAPLQPVPAEVEATFTPIYTEEPGKSATRPTAVHTLAFNVTDVPPAASPVPVAAPRLVTGERP